VKARILGESNRIHRIISWLFEAFFRLMFALLHFLKECVKIFKKAKSKKQQHLDLVPFMQTHQV
jgi:hypothetical protein